MGGRLAPVRRIQTKIEGIDESIWRLQTRINHLEDNDTKEDVTLEDVVAPRA